VGGRGILDSVLEIRGWGRISVVMMSDHHDGGQTVTVQMMKRGINDPSKADIARAMIGFLSTVGILALLYEPTVRLFFPELLLFTAIFIICVLTAKSKMGVLVGIIAIILVRSLISVVIFGIRFVK